MTTHGVHFMQRKTAMLPNPSLILSSTTTSPDVASFPFPPTSNSPLISDSLSRNSSPRESLHRPCTCSPSTLNRRHADDEDVSRNVSVSPHGICPPRFADFIGGFYDRPKTSVANHSLRSIAIPSTLIVGNTNTSPSPSPSFPPFLTPTSSLPLRIRYQTLRTALLRCTLLSLPHYHLPTMHDSLPTIQPPSFAPDHCARIVSIITLALPIAEELEDHAIQSKCWYWLGRAETGRENWEQAWVAFEQALHFCVEGGEEQMNLEKWGEMVRERALGMEEPSFLGLKIGEELYDMAELGIESEEEEGKGGAVQWPLAWRMPTELQRRAFTEKEREYITHVPWGMKRLIGDSGR